MAYTYEYPRPGVTTDCIVVTKGEEKEILLIQRGIEPFMGSWALPGGFVEIDEDLMDAAKRELLEETGLKVDEMTQFGTYGKPGRDPRGRTISVVYSIEIEKKVEVNGMDDAREAKWFNLKSLPSLAFDHEDIMKDYIRKNQ